MAMKIEEIDANFKLAALDGRDYVFQDVHSGAFELDGLAFWEQEHAYCRMPVASLPEQNQGVQGLAWHTAGVQLRFRTNSQSIALKATLRHPGDMNNMARTGSSSFDLYEGVGKDKRFAKVVIAGAGVTELSGLIFNSASSKEREFTINFPLYNGVNNVAIGLEPGSVVLPPTPFATPGKVVFYGSSITQGGCASRPGNCYTQLLSRRLDFHCLNFGFSGSAKAEPAMSKVLATLDARVFVLDYDHNAPTAAYLAETHERLFKELRQARPNMPIILVTRPDWPWSEDGNAAADERRSIVRKTYENALAAGDKLVWFVDGETMFEGLDRDMCTVDGCHPNDFGFFGMANAVEPALVEALKASMP